jgi:hypothetical protein
MPLKLHKIAGGTADAAKYAQDCLFVGNIKNPKISPLQSYKLHWANICYNLVIPSGLDQINMKINWLTK